MSKEKNEFDTLVNAYSPDFLMEQGKAQGIQWNEDSKKEINWFRFCQALMGFLKGGSHLDLSGIDEDTAGQMLDHYTQLRELHKQSMIPHLRDAMSKLYAEASDPSKTPEDYIQGAYEHLENKGGRAWADKISTLTHLNTQIGLLQSKVPQQTDADGGQTQDIQTK